jgi:DNA-binding response OmpR family regulator
MLTSRTVLLIDDDADILEAMRSAIEYYGYRVLTARDGISGLDCAGRERPDLVVTDMMMPGQSGFLVLDALKQSADPPKVVMITASTGRQHQAYAEILGADDYLLKPFALSKLVDTVRRLCPPAEAANPIGTLPAAAS